ncbi:MAG: hypothetical protein JWO36_6333 [Myxococcales bacterium]|nr:hypothetical protein [Myxococcales bacterium]
MLKWGMRLATMGLLVGLGCASCKGSTKEHAQRVEQKVESTAKQAAKQAQTEAGKAGKSIGLGTPAGFADAMKAFCAAVPDNGKTYTKQQQQQMIKDVLYKHPNAELVALWKSIEGADHDTRFQKILEEVDRAQLQSCHLLDLMYEK